MWHTHLKKRLPQNYKQSHDQKKRSKKQPKLDVDASKSNQDAKLEQQQEPVNNNFPFHASNSEDMMPLSPPQCSSHMSSSSLTTSDNNGSINNNHDMSLNVNDDIDTPENNLALDEDFWSEVLSSDNSGETTSGFPTIDYDHQFLPMSPLMTEEGVLIDASSSSVCDDGMDFWCNVYARAEEFTQLLEL